MRYGALFILPLLMAVSTSTPASPATQPTPNAGSHALVFVHIAVIYSKDGDQVERLLEGNSIRSAIEGSVVYGVSVRPEDRDKAIELLKADAAKRGYWIRFSQASIVPAPATRPSVADDHAGQALLKLRIAVPERNAMVAQDEHSHFHVVIENVSDRPQQIYDEWNSWGYFNLHFEFWTPDGERKMMKKLGKSWFNNVPTSTTLQPGEVTVWDVYPNDTIWTAVPLPERHHEVKVRIRAIFEQKDAGEMWTGRALSPEEEITFRNYRLQP